MFTEYVVIACVTLLTFSVAWRIPRFKFYLKFFIFCATIMLGAFFYSLWFIFVGRTYKNSWRFKNVFKFAGYVIGLRPILKNEHLLDTSQPRIIVSNHQSCLDVASLADVWPPKCTIIAKASLKFAGFVGVVAWYCKLIFIDRSKHKDALAIMRWAATEAKENGVSVYVFPEGTRACTGEMLPFKKGAFHLAISSQFPIQPVVITPYTRFLDYEKNTFESAPYYVEVLPLISTEGMTEADVETLLEKTRSQMASCIEHLKTEYPPSSP